MSHITLAASANAFEQLFIALRDNFALADSDSGSFGPFTASYSVAVHLENGDITLHDDNTLEIENVDIVWDTLKVKLCFELPGFCVPGFCIIPDPWNGCLVGFPGICIGGPVCLPLDLSGLVSEITEVRAHLTTQYRVDPSRPPGLTDLQAELAGFPNKWRIFIDPDFVLISPIDVPASIGNIIENLIRQAIEDMLPGWFPDWGKDVLFWLLGPIIDLLKGILGIVGAIEDWIGDVIGNKLNLLGWLQTAVADYFASRNPIYELIDPYPVLPASGGLLPVAIPIRQLGATINSKEMIVNADVGA